jgi:hypothetical protein
MRVDLQTAALLRDIAAVEPLSLVVSGDCMEPLLESGDRIRVRARRVYWPGDVVAFRRADGRLLVHRVLGYAPGLHGWSVFAKGDNLSREDEPVARDAVIGRLIDRGGRATHVGSARRWRSMLEFLRMLLRRSLRTWVSATSS